VLRLLILMSLVIAAFFIVNSAFRRRLIWSIRVTLAFYGAMFVIRLVLWAVWQLFQPSTDIADTFLAIAGIGLVSAVIWVAFRYWTERRLRQRQMATPARRRRRR
jgi:protein-S-isoprenylcysteine O-methyltransferase Ste14